MNLFENLLICAVNSFIDSNLRNVPPPPSMPFECEMANDWHVVRSSECRCRMVLGIGVSTHVYTYIMSSVQLLRHLLFSLS